MQITFAGKDLTSQASTGARWYGPSDFRINGKRMSQALRYVRSIQTTFADRKNTESTVSFNVTRQHGTIAAAEKFALSHEVSLPNQGLLVMKSFDGVSQQTTLSLSNAFLESVDVQYNGSMSTTNYVFRGGKVNTNDPKVQPTTSQRP